MPVINLARQLVTTYARQLLPTARRVSDLKDKLLKKLSAEKRFRYNAHVPPVAEELWARAHPAPLTDADRQAVEDFNRRVGRSSSTKDGKPKPHPWADDLKKRKHWQIVRRKPWITPWAFGDDVTEAAPFANIPHQVLKSKAFKALADTDYRLLIYAVAQFTGRNNGEITLTPEQVKDRLGWGRARFFRSLRRLINADALERVAKAVGVLPALYKVTFLSNQPGRTRHDED